MIEELRNLLNMDPDEDPHVKDFYYYGHCMNCGMLDLIPFSMYPTMLCDGCWEYEEYFEDPYLKEI